MAALAGVLGAPCAPGGGEAPPRIVFGADLCDRCRMIISEERHAASARGPEGREARFDDPGCLLDFLDDQDVAQWRAWGHDAEDRWRPAEELWWVRGEPSSTPMGSGWLGFSSLQEAQGSGATPVAWSAIRTGDPPS